MKFYYKKYGLGIIRPVIPVVLEYNDKRVVYEALVDSGADNCIFPGYLADILGIAEKEEKIKKIYGITGEGEKYFTQKIDLSVGGWPYEIEAGFLPKIAKMGYGVLGQKGFFDVFIVKFDYLKGEIEVKPR